MSHLSFPTWLTCLLDLTPFHWHTILVRGDELDGSFLWGLSHGWLRRVNPIGVVEFGGCAGSPQGLLVGSECARGLRRRAAGICRAALPEQGVPNEIEAYGTSYGDLDLTQVSGRWTAKGWQSFKAAFPSYLRLAYGPAAVRCHERHEVGAYPVPAVPMWVSHLKVLSFLSEPQNLGLHTVPSTSPRPMLSW